jgi:AmmeMemoRadiSam system protein A
VSGSARGDPSGSARGDVSGSGKGNAESERTDRRLEPAARRGVFVTLLRSAAGEGAGEEELRGCIGRIEPDLPLEEAVCEAAVDAALHDDRFEPVTLDELGRIEIEVTVLSRPRPVASWREIVIGAHGIILEKDRRRALFLPQVATEQGWSLEETLAALSRKAGLGVAAWKENASFSVFTGQVFRERKERQ